MLIVSELSINHLGSNNIAKAMITEAKKSGAHFVKFKFKNVDKYYTDNSKKWRNFNFKTYRKSLELDKDKFQEIIDHCKKIGIGFFATVHDQESLDFIQRFNPAMYKIASMDAGKDELFNLVSAVCSKENKPLVYSMGGKSHSFFIDAVEKIDRAQIEAFILHTVSIYPTPVGKSNIDYIKDMLKDSEDEKRIHIGYSGHEAGFAASIGAAINGIKMIERHFTLSRDINIHHIKCGLLPEEFEQMVNSINDIKEELGNNDSFSKDELKFLDGLHYE